MRPSRIRLFTDLADGLHILMKGSHNQSVDLPAGKGQAKVQYDSCMSDDSGLGIHRQTDSYGWVMNPRCTPILVVVPQLELQ